MLIELYVCSKREGNFVVSVKTFSVSLKQSRGNSHTPVSLERNVGDFQVGDLI